MSAPDFPLERWLQSPSAVVELGSGDRRPWFEARFPACVYTAFSPKESSPNASLHDPAYPLPLPDHSQDAFVCIDQLAHLRMDQLYMVLAEARRVLKPGGVCILRSLGFSPTLAGRIAAHARFRFRGERALDLHHYISPEDWAVDFQETGEGWLRPQTVVLRREAEDA